MSACYYYYYYMINKENTHIATALTRGSDVLILQNIRVKKEPMTGALGFQVIGGNIFGIEN